MCFFDQTLWACGYWRWGHFREQCPKEYRTGETCGLKFVYQTNHEVDVCKLCKDIEKKRRRFEKLDQDIRRWCDETKTNKRTASIEKAEKEIVEVTKAMKTMTDQHADRKWRTV